MNTYPSPFATSLVVVAIVVGAIAAPLIPFILIGALAAQGGLNSRHRREREAALSKARERQRREKDAALRYFAS